MEFESARRVPGRASGEKASPPSSRRHHHHSHRNSNSHRSSRVVQDGAPAQRGRGDEVMGLLVEHHIGSSRHHHSRHHSHHSRQRSPARALSGHAGDVQDDAASAATNATGKHGESSAADAAATFGAQQPLTSQQPHATPESSRASTRSSRLPMRRSERASVVGPGSSLGNVRSHAAHPSGDEVNALNRPPRKASQDSVAPSSSDKFFTSSKQSAMVAQDKVGEAADGSSRVEKVVSLDAVHSPAAATAATEPPASSTAAAALAALKAAPQSDVLVRSWQADVAPDTQKAPSLPASLVGRGREKEKEEGTEERSRRSARHHPAPESSTAAASTAAARSSSRRERGEEVRHNGGYAAAAAPHEATPTSQRRDSRSSSRYDKAAYASPLPSAPAKAVETPATTMDEDEKERESDATSHQQQLQDEVAAAATPNESATVIVGATSASGRSPQRKRTPSTNGHRLTTFEPFQFNTARRNTVRRTSSPRACVPGNPLMDLPKEERERLMALPHKLFDAPGTWRLDMRFEEDRKEYFRQTHLIDPLTRTRPGMRQFYIPEQADLFGMYPGIPMTKDAEGNDIVAHQAPIPIQGESFVKAQKPYAPPRASPQRKFSTENIVYPPPPPTAAAASLSSQEVDRPNRGLSGFVWGYGEEANGRRSGSTPTRGRIVSDITAPYRRNPAMSTGQIGHLGGDGTLNIFRMAPSPKHADPSISYEQPPQQLHAGLVGTPPQTSLHRPMRDASQASTLFAVMQPTLSPWIPTTTNSDYGQSPPPPLQTPSDNRGRNGRREHEREAAWTRPQVQHAPRPYPPNHPLEAVLLQPSVGDNSGSQSPSEGVVAPLRRTSPAAQAVVPMAIATGEDTDQQPPVEGAEATAASKPPEERPPHCSSRRNEKKDTSESHMQREEDAPVAKPAEQQPSRSSTASGKSERSAAAAATSAAPSTAASATEEENVASKSRLSPRKRARRKSSALTPSPTPASAAAAGAGADATAAAVAAAPASPPPLAQMSSTNTDASSELLTPKSAQPDSVCPVPSPTPQLPGSASSRVSKDRDIRAVHPAAAAEASTTVEDEHEESKEWHRKEKPSRANSSADVPPPLPPPPRAAPTTTSAKAATTATTASSAARTREASINMTDVASMHEEHYVPTPVSDVGAPAAASTAPSHRSASLHIYTAPTAASSRRSEKFETKTQESSHHDRDRDHRPSASRRMSAESSSAPETYSSTFSSRGYVFASGSNTPATSVKEHSRRSGSKSGFRAKPLVAESSTQTEFVFVLDPLQGRQFLQREQEWQLSLEGQLHQSSAMRSASSSEQRAAGVSTGVSPTRMRRTGYANTSTNVRNLLRWS